MARLLYYYLRPPPANVIAVQTAPLNDNEMKSDTFKRGSSLCYSCNITGPAVTVVLLLSFFQPVESLPFHISRTAVRVHVLGETKLNVII